MMSPPLPQIPSTAIPIEVKSSTSLPSSTGTSTNSRIHWAESFIFLKCGLQLVGHRRSDVLYKASLHGPIDFEIAARSLRLRILLGPPRTLSASSSSSSSCPSSSQKQTGQTSNPPRECNVLYLQQGHRNDLSGCHGSVMLLKALMLTPTTTLLPTTDDVRRTTLLIQTAPKISHPLGRTIANHPIHTSALQCG